MAVSDENGVTFRYLARANNTSEWMWTIYFKYTAASIASLTLTCLLSVLHCYLTQRNFNSDHVYRPTKLVYTIEIYFY